MTAKIIIDDGSSHIKVCREVDGNPELSSFSSRVIDGATTNADGYSSSAYETNGNKYSVTKSALDTIPTNNRAYQTSEVNRVLIHHALRSINSDSVDILVTLPISQFFNPDGTKNEDLFTKKIDNIKTPVIALDGSHLPQINTVKLIPEGYAVLNVASDQLNIPVGRVLIADIGGTTTDLVAINESNDIENFLSVPVGALSMLNGFKASCIARFNINNLTDEQTLTGLTTGSLLNEDVNNEANAAIQGFKNKINRHISSLGDIESFDAVVYSGGGAELFKCDDSILTTEYPQFDNALGCYDFFVNEVME